MRRNYRIKLGLGYDEAKFNYLNNRQFSCFYYNIKTQEQFPTQKVGNFIYNGVYMYMIIYIYIPLLTKEMSCKKLEILGLMLCLLLLVRN